MMSRAAQNVSTDTTKVSWFQRKRLVIFWRAFSVGRVRCATNSCCDNDCGPEVESIALRVDAATRSGRARAAEAEVAVAALGRDVAAANRGDQVVDGATVGGPADDPGGGLRQAH